MNVNRGVGSVRVWIRIWMARNGQDGRRGRRAREVRRAGEEQEQEQEKNGRVETWIIGVDDAERVWKKSQEHEPLLPILPSLQSGDGGLGDQSPRTRTLICFHGMDVGRSCSDKLGIKLIFALYR